MTSPTTRETADHAELARLAWRAKAAVLRSRGKANSLHDIEQAADYLDAAASVRSSHAPDLDRLAQIAEAATQGVWTVDAVRAHQAVRTSIMSGLTVIARIFEGKPKRAEANAAFIAAFNPAVCSALLSEIAALRGERDGLRRLRDDLRDTTNAYQARYRQAERQRDEAVVLLREFHTRIMMERRCNSLGTNVAEPIMEKTRAFLANQGAD